MSRGIEPAREITSRLVRSGDSCPVDDDWRALSPSDRISRVWTLTKLCAGWGEPKHELRLQRAVGRVQRPQS